MPRLAMRAQAASRFVIAHPLGIVTAVQIAVYRSVERTTGHVILSEALCAKSKNLRTSDTFSQIFGAKILRLACGSLRMTGLEGGAILGVGAPIRRPLRQDTANSPKPNANP